ncbi:ubiquitin-conjugating enzyme/RWD-like protein [Phellopilus nigrolimitatus]|nr:ubiquitin-conjugating enzyme/RWD-like protein [Phellopilus nigrolimitatus]
MPPAQSHGMTMKRINREIKDLQKEDLGGMTLEPSEANVFHWKASIPGPEGSPYEGGVFSLAVDLGSDYPFSAPKVAFVTRIYHMNISDRGNICIDVLKQNWSPALSLYKVLLSLSSLLTDPNPKDPLVPSIANEYMRNRQKHDSTAREWTRLYAQPPKPKEVPTNAPSQSKGKAKAVPSSASSINGESSRTTQTLRRSTRTQQSMPTGLSEEVIDLSDLDDDPASSRVSTKPNTRAKANTKRKRSATGGEEPEDGHQNGGRRRRRADVGQSGDVIVIED